MQKFLATLALLAVLVSAVLSSPISLKTIEDMCLMTCGECFYEQVLFEKNHCEKHSLNSGEGAMRFKSNASNTLVVSVVLCTCSAVIKGTTIQQGISLANQISKMFWYHTCFLYQHSHKIFLKWYLNIVSFGIFFAKNGDCIHKRRYSLVSPTTEFLVPIFGNFFHLWRTIFTKVLPVNRKKHR